MENKEEPKKYPDMQACGVKERLYRRRLRKTKLCGLNSARESGLVENRHDRSLTLNSPRGGEGGILEITDRCSREGTKGLRKSKKPAPKAENLGGRRKPRNSPEKENYDRETKGPSQERTRRTGSAGKVERASHWGAECSNYRYCRVWICPRRAHKGGGKSALFATGLKKKEEDLQQQNWMKKIKT